ncbi:AAA family ATPase [Nonomuraea sp. NPDC048882]|uniref:AAA family ATPase n=1 Tax=Nonomuraea sp. NPDC048882 TaxID=3154347 RepID=UPI00340EA6EC
MGTSWPFAGREQELGHLLRLTRDPTAQGVLVTGPPGVGKSALAGRLAGRLGGAFTVRASRALRNVPGGSPLPAYGTGSGCGGGGASCGCGGTSRGGATACGGGTGHCGGECGGCRCSPGLEVLTLVDDAHLLDSHSAEVLAALVRAGRIRLIATVCSEANAGGPVVELWRDGRLRRFDVDPLGKADVSAVLATALGGPADNTTVSTLTELTGGNALWLRELMHAMRASRSLQHAGGVWRLSGDPPPARGAADLVNHRVGSLPEGAASVLEYATFGEPVEVGTLAGLCSEAAVLEALEFGVIEVTREWRGEVARPAHPLYGEAARDRCPAERRTQRYADLVAAVESEMKSTAETATGAGVTHRGQFTARAAAGTPVEPSAETTMSATMRAASEATLATAPEANLKATPEATPEPTEETTSGTTPGATLSAPTSGAPVKASPEAAEARRHCDAARVAAWRLAGGLRADAGTLVGACKLAEAVHDHASAIRLGRAAMREGGGAGAAIGLATALNGAGRPDQALAVLTAAEDACHARGDDQQRVRLTLARARTLAWGLDRLGDALDLLATTRKELRDPEPTPDTDPARTSPGHVPATQQPRPQDETTLDRAARPHHPPTDRTEPPDVSNFDRTDAPDRTDVPDETNSHRTDLPDETNPDPGSPLHRPATRQMGPPDGTEADRATPGWLPGLERAALRHELAVERARLLAEAARPDEALRAVEHISSNPNPPRAKALPPQGARRPQTSGPTTSLANHHHSPAADPLAPRADDHTRLTTEPTARDHTTGAIARPADDRVSLALALALCHWGWTNEAVAVLRDVLPAVQAEKPQNPPRPQEPGLTHGSSQHTRVPARATSALTGEDPAPPWTSAHMTWALCGWFAGDLMAVERAIASMGPGWPGTSEQVLARGRLAVLRGELGAALFLLRAPVRHETPLAAAERRAAYAMVQALRGDAAGARASLDMTETRASVDAIGAQATLGATEAQESLDVTGAQPPLGAEARVPLDAARAPVTWTALQHWVALAEAWTQAAAGWRARAVELALAHAKECRDGGPSSFEAVALHDAVRLGAPASALPRLGALAATHDGLRVRLALRHAHALARGDADALTAVAADFAAAGLGLFAAEAGAQAEALRAGSAPEWRPHCG